LRKFFARDCFGTQVYYPISIEETWSAAVVALSDSARRSSADYGLNGTDDASRLAVDVAAVAAVEHYWTRNDLMDFRMAAASHEAH